MYSSASTVVLDDPFSALDGKTARGIWEDVFCSNFARDRTIVLVTQLPWILPQADLVVILKNGTISSVEQNIGVVRTAKVAAPDGGSKQPSESGSQSNGLDSKADGGMAGPDEAKASGSDEMAATGITGRLKGKFTSHDYLFVANYWQSSATCYILVARLPSS